MLEEARHTWSRGDPSGQGTVDTAVTDIRSEEHKLFGLPIRPFSPQMTAINLAWPDCRLSMDTVLLIYRPMGLYEEMIREHSGSICTAGPH